MIIRRGVLSDLPSIQRLNQALFQYEHDQHYYDGNTYNLNWPYEDDGIKYFSDCLGQSEAAALFVAESDGRPIGYLAASHFVRTYRSPVLVAYLDNMYVDPDHRSSGVGSALIDDFKAWASEKGAGLIRVSAMAKNERARRFYKKNGFLDLEVTLEQPLIRSKEHTS